MARTPLFDHLRRALRLARLANATGRPAAEIVARARAQWSRRELLARAGVAAAGLALGCHPRRPRPRPAAWTGREMIVVGGGIAGLTCAYRLDQAGIPLRLLEGQPRLGGRMWSLRDHFPEGLVCELGGELIDTGHAALRGLCAELELPLDDYRRDARGLDSDVWFFAGRRVQEAEIVEAFRPVAARIDEAWEAIPGESISYLESTGAEAVDRMTLADWLAAAGAEGWFYDLLDVGYTTEFGLDVAEQSPWNLLGFIDTDPDPFRIYGDSDERFHIRGGSDLLPARLAAAVGDRIETGIRLEALAQAADGTYRLSVASDAGSREMAADHVVLAIPFTKLREVRLDLPLPAVKRRAIAELGYGTNAKLVVGFAERLWRTRGGSNGSVLTDLPFQMTWEASRLQPGGTGILAVFTGGRRGVEMGEGTPAEQSARFARELERIFPGAAALAAGQARFHWPSFAWTRGSYSCYRPGQWTTIAGCEGERVGNLHFAGEHTSRDFQAYMEGGCESGERAASEILADHELAAWRAELPPRSMPRWPLRPGNGAG